jgi:hypothetical protein
VIRDRYKKSEAPKAEKAPAAKKAAANGNGSAPAKTEKPAAKPVKKPDDKKPVIPDSIIELIADSIDDLADDDGFIDLSNLGNLIIKKQPDFDPRNYGYGKLSNMLKNLPRFEVEVRATADPHVKPIYIRDLEAQ